MHSLFLVGIFLLSLAWRDSAEAKEIQFMLFIRQVFSTHQHLHATFTSLGFLHSLVWNDTIVLYSDVWTSRQMLWIHFLCFILPRPPGLWSISIAMPGSGQKIHFNYNYHRDDVDLWRCFLTSAFPLPLISGCLPVWSALHLPAKWNCSAEHSRAMPPASGCRARREY